MNDKFKVIDIFSGAGGFSKGFELTNKFKIIDNAEIDEYALETFKKNFKYIPESQKIIDLSSRKETNDFIKRNSNKGVDVIIGGFPCQGYSLIGKRDSNDKRNQLYKPTLKIINELNPRMFVLENVPGILSMNDGDDVRDILSFLKKEGWNSKYVILDSSNFGVPQVRRRVFFFGTKDEKINLDKVVENLLKRNDEKISVKDSIGYLLDIGDGRVLNHEKTNHTMAVKKRMELLSQGEPLYRNFQGGTKKLFWDKPSPTIRDNHGGTFIHPKENRYLTAREIAELQTFPRNFKFIGPKTKQLKQIGNAVPVILSREIAKEVAKWLK